MATSYCMVLGADEVLHRLVQGEVMFKEGNSRQRIRGLIVKHGHAEDLSPKAEPKREELRDNERLDVLRNYRDLAEGLEVV